MSDFYNKYPYTDFHELNLDWVIERVKKLTEDWAATLEEWNSTEEQWQELYNYVHDYFDNLNVQTEINNKINAMIADGTFQQIATPIIQAKVATDLPGVVSQQIGGTVAGQIGGTVATQLPGVVSDQIGAAVVSPVNAWLAANITQPTTPVVDTSLSISGAAADAAITGDWLNGIQNAFDERVEDLDGLIYTGKLLATARPSGYSNYSVSLTAGKKYRLFCFSGSSFKAFLRGSDGTTQINFYPDSSHTAVYSLEVSGSSVHEIHPYANASYIRITDNTASDVVILVYEVTSNSVINYSEVLDYDSSLFEDRLENLDGAKLIANIFATARPAYYSNYACSMNEMQEYMLCIHTGQSFHLYARGTDGTTQLFFSIDGNALALEQIISATGTYKIRVNGTLGYLRVTDNTTSNVIIKAYDISNTTAYNIPDKHVILCYGDSLTQGYGGGGTTYPSVLQSALGADYTVNNYGIGGETAQMIAGRQGGVPLMVQPVSLPYNVFTNVTIKSYFGSDIDALFKQGSGGKAPITLNGHDVSQMYSGDDNTIRNNENSTLIISRPAILKPFSATQINKTLIIWIGTNGWGNSDTETLREMIRKMIDYNGNDNYIILGVITGANLTTFRATEQKFVEEFGYHYIALRDYLVSYGLSDAGITPTAEDLDRISQGLVPSSLLYDGVHLNASGYTVVGNLIHTRGQELNLW